MTDLQWVTIIFMAPFILAGAAWIIATVFFRVKARYMRSLMNGNYDPPQGGD
jgi:hypothetical protein